MFRLRFDEESESEDERPPAKKVKLEPPPPTAISAGPSNNSGDASSVLYEFKLRAGALELPYRFEASPSGPAHKVTWEVECVCEMTVRGRFHTFY